MGEHRCLVEGKQGRGVECGRAGVDRSDKISWIASVYQRDMMQMVAEAEWNQRDGGEGEIRSVYLQTIQSCNTLQMKTEEEASTRTRMR